MHVPCAQVLALHALVIQNSLARSSVGLVPRTNGPSEYPVVRGLHREKQIRNRWDTTYGVSSQEGTLFLIPGSVSCPRPPGGGWWSWDQPGGRAPWLLCSNLGLWRRL